VTGSGNLRGVITAMWLLLLELSKTRGGSHRKCPLSLGEREKTLISRTHGRREVLQPKKIGGYKKQKQRSRPHIQKKRPRECGRLSPTRPLSLTKDLEKQVHGGHEGGPGKKSGFKDKKVMQQPARRGRTNVVNGEGRYGLRYLGVKLTVE